MSDNRHFKVTDQDGVTLLHLAEDFSDRKYILEFDEALMEFVEEARPKRLVLSFEDVSFYSSEAIKALIHVKKRLVEFDGKLGLCSMKKELREILEILNLVGTVFNVYDSCDDAVNDLRA